MSDPFGPVGPPSGGSTGRGGPEPSTPLSWQATLLWSVILICITALILAGKLG